MNLGMKIFNSAVFNAFQGYADQGAVFEDDKYYTLRKEWRYSDGRVGKFLLDGKMIYQALNNSEVNDRFKSIDTSTMEFANQMADNLLLNYK